MFHKATDLIFKDGTILQVSFQDGIVKEYDISILFDKYPQLKRLEDRGLFVSGRLSGFYGIIWTDELDLETETVYKCGMTVSRQAPPPGIVAGEAVMEARANAGMTQKELSALTGIDQADLSRIEKGLANPTIHTLQRIAEALDCELRIGFVRFFPDE